LRGTLSEISRHPVERIDYVELDEVLTRVARPYVAEATLAALDDPRVRLLHDDGRTFVKEADEKYDVIIVDVPDPATAVLNRYYTQEFFCQARGLLHSDGVFVIGAVSTAGLRGTAVANRNATVYHTLRSVFSHVLLAGERFLFYFATDSPHQVSADVETLQRRYQDRNIQTDGFSHHHFHLLLEPSQLRRVNWILRHHGRRGDAHLTGPQSGPLLPDPIAEQQQAEERLPPVQERFFINSDSRPIGYYHTLMFWGDLAGAGHTRVLWWLLQIRPWWILPIAAVLLAVPVALRVVGNAANAKRSAHYAVIVAVFTTGLSTMTLQVALLFSFQSTYGFVYEMVGLIVAIFMAGLASGTAFTRRYVTRKANMDTLAAVQLSVAVLALLIAFVLPRAAEIESGAVVFALFSLVTFVAGLLNGVDFPLAAECYRVVHQRAERSAGTVYGVELFGACLGAALASAAVAPVLGIAACCLLATMANGTAFVVLLMVRRSHA
jgi:spermidine synthase